MYYSVVDLMEALKVRIVKKVANPISWKPNVNLLKAMKEWLRKNPTFDKSKLLDMAVSKFIQEEQVLEPVELVTADSADAVTAAKRAMKKHRKAVDRLK